MNRIFGKILEKFGKKHPNKEAGLGFKGERKMKNQQDVTFHKLAKKFGLTAAVILAGKKLLEGKETLSYDEWWEVYAASTYESDLYFLAEAKMFETATTANQLARRIGAYSKKEHLYYLVKAAGMASTMDELAKLYLASNRSEMSEEYEMVRDSILERMKAIARIW